MIELLQDLTQEQIALICAECGITVEELFSMTEDELYTKVYDTCCIIEEIETVATLDDGSELSSRGRIAADIVTILGEAIADD